MTYAAVPAGLSEDQLVLRETARRLAEDLQLADSAQMDTSELASRCEQLWSALTQLGLVGLLVPEHLGGSGGTLADACVVAETLGAALSPAPFLATAITAATILRRCGGPDEALQRLAEGAPFAVLLDRNLRWPSAVPGVVAWGFVPGCELVGMDGPHATLSAAGSADRIETVDALHPLVEVGAVAGERRGFVPQEEGPPADEVRRVRSIVRVGAAAELLGLAEAALEEAVAHAVDRQQYGRAIGSFQAVQHLCAEMLVDVETMRSAVYGAASSVESAPLAEAERVAAATHSWSAEAAVRTCETGVQVLGGIGVTWEHRAHRRLRSAHFLGRLFGGARAEHELLAGQLLDAPLLEGERG